MTPSASGDEAQEDDEEDEYHQHRDDRHGLLLRSMPSRSEPSHGHAVLREFLNAVVSDARVPWADPSHGYRTR
jgi:hypothetical protein